MQNRLAMSQLQRHTTAAAARKNTAATAPGDVVWEPFGGLASAAVAAIETGRIPYVAETDRHFAALAAHRLDEAIAARDRPGLISSGQQPRAPE
jgi:DNA modification methylase